MQNLNSSPRDPLAWIQSEYDWRRLKNPRYSLRAFAQLAGIRSGRLSELLSGKRRLTPDICARIAARLGKSSTECEQFLATLRPTKNATSRSKKSPPQKFNELSEDTFSQISDWYYLALLNVLTIDGQSQAPEDLAKKLGLNVAVVRRALATFERLGLIEKIGRRFVRTSQPLTTSRDVPSNAIRNYHLQMLEKAQEALVHVPVCERDFSASLISLSASELKEFKDLIETGRREVSRRGAKAKRERLYALTIQFFPLTQEM